MSSSENEVNVGLSSLKNIRWKDLAVKDITPTRGDMFTPFGMPHAIRRASASVSTETFMFSDVGCWKFEHVKPKFKPGRML